MRVLPLVICLVCVALPFQAIAKPRPKIAMAALDGDPGNKVALAVIDALAKDFVVIGPKEVGREKTRLGISELGPKEARKLAIKLDAVAVVDGSVTTSGSRRSVHLEIHPRGKPASGFTVEFKTTASPGFRRGVHDEIARKVEAAGDAADPADDDDDQPRNRAAKQAADDDRARKQAADDDRARKQAADDDRARKQAADDDDRKRRPSDDGAAAAKRTRPRDDDTAAGKRARPRDDGSDRRRKRVAAGDDEPAIRKRKRRNPDDGEAAPQTLARAGAGASLAQRRLTYDTRSGFRQVPPRVITTAGAGRVDGEIYPFALANSGSNLAPLGLAAAYDKTFGLSIKIPNQTVRAPINQSHFSIGARYRFGVGETSTLIFGLDYVGRHYIADRSGLMMVILDAPDVDYSAIAPGVAARTPITDTITLFGGLDGLLMLGAGPIQKVNSYGPATVYGVDLVGGVDITLAKQIGLRVAVEYSQINLSFGDSGIMTINRDNDPATQDILSAVDRSIGVSATIGLVY